MQINSILNATSAGKEGKSNEDRFQERMDTLEYRYSNHRSFIIIADTEHISLYTCIISSITPVVPPLTVCGAFQELPASTQRTHGASKGNRRQL